MYCRQQLDVLGFCLGKCEPQNVTFAAGNSAIAVAYAGCPSTLMTRGRGAPADRVRRRNSFAAIRSRFGDNMNSMVSPGRIDGAIEVGPIAGNLHVGFVDPP